MDAAGKYSDRRIATRALTERLVLIWPQGASAPLIGQVCDISLTGIALVMKIPVPAGAWLDLEVQPKPDCEGSHVIYVRGRVTRTIPIGENKFLMGIHLRMQLAGAELYVRYEVAAAETVDAPLPKSETDHQVPGRVLHRRRRRYILVLAGLVVLLATGVAWWRPYQAASDSHAPNASVALIQSSATDPDRKVEASACGPGMFASTRPLPEVALIPPDLGSDVIDVLGARTPDAPASLAALMEAQSLVSGGQWQAAGRQLGAMGSFTAANANAEIQRLMARAQVHWASERPASALAALEGAPAENLDPLWLDATVAMSAAIVRREPGDSVYQHILSRALELKESTDSSGTEHGALHIEIDPHQFILRVLRSGNVIAAYPVGLGYDGSTPSGNFVIANKIVNPKWYNRGTSVPAGDPRNPLGSRWMGLGTEDGPTSYGIHATADTASIGAAQSRGCVRMRPEDAEGLFDLCPIGTAVYILP